jgi:hypothetical protein
MDRYMYSINVKCEARLLYWSLFTVYFYREVSLVAERHFKFNVLFVVLSSSFKREMCVGQMVMYSISSSYVYLVV